MKHCFACGRVTPGDPLFCSGCGATYDVKLCPRMHRSPRHAEVCSQCGSREFSTPQPKVSIGTRLLYFLERLLLTVSVVAVVLAVLVAFLSTQNGQNAFAALAVLAALGWWFWSQLPEWLKKRIHRSGRRKRAGHEE